MSIFKKVYTFVLAFIITLAIFGVGYYLLASGSEKAMILNLFFPAAIAAGSFYRYMAYSQQCAISYKTQSTGVFAIGSVTGLIISMIISAYIVSNLATIS